MKTEREIETENARRASAVSPVSRREFLQSAALGAGAIVAGGALWSGLGASAAPPAAKIAAPETLTKTLYESLTPAQKEAVCMAWDSPRRAIVQANWGIVKKPIGQVFNPEQKEMIQGILRGVTTEAWYPKIQEQMRNDAAGLDNYYVALFGDPKQEKFEWVLTGRHVTLRADGHSLGAAAFGGPIFYGHAPKDTEDPNHPGNIYWQQAQQANEVFKALDGKQRDKALLEKAPNESAVKLQGAKGVFPGVAIGDLSRDQKALVRKTMQALLSPYRPSDAKEVMRDIAANGGLDKIHLSFYKQDDLGHDGVWDIWRLEGPALVWHFRGAPHVHTWVNVAKNAADCPTHTDGA